MAAITVGHEQLKMQKMRQVWLKDQQSLYADPVILKFIADVLFRITPGISAADSVDVIHTLYSSGYCYYFASMLESAFPGGKICVCAPYSHIVYIYEGYVYDIDGVSSAEYDQYLPVDLIGDHVNDFKHIPGKALTFSSADINELMQKYCPIYALANFPNDREIINRSVAVAYQTGEYEKEQVYFEEVSKQLQRETSTDCLSQEHYHWCLNDFCQQKDLSYPLIRRLQEHHIEYYMADELNTKFKTEDFTGAELDKLRFYYAFVHDKWSMEDIEDYARLNNLFGYDIGRDNATVILKAMKPVYASSLLKVPWKNSKFYIQNICIDKGLDVDMSRWRHKPIECLKYSFS